MTITTTAAATAKRGAEGPAWRTEAGATLACLLLLCAPIGLRARHLVSRGTVSLLLGLAVLTALSTLIGCGNSVKANPNSPSPNLGTPLGVQTLTITTATTINGTTATQHSYLSVDVQ